jgi:pimeloyl-ACP methyl ester carboxylesterase
MKPFQVAWTQSQVDAVLRQVREVRLPPAPPGAGWSLGCDAEFLERLRARWTDGYDWRGAMDALNRFPQFTTTIDGQDLHFVHVKGEGSAARPLLITHGWPGSHYEFWEVIEPLAFPSRHGGRAEDAFDIVAPSLPGFGFSGKPAQIIGQRETARLLNKLMTEGLGYPTYLAQGGDWGAIVTTWLGIDHPKTVRAIHLNMLVMITQAPPQNEAERVWIAESAARRDRFGAYSALQRTKPQSLGYAAAGNPLGQAAWIVERFYDWTDVGERALDEVFPMDHLITNAMIYVMTDSFVSGAWYYNGASRELAPLKGALPRCEVPTAFAAFPGDHQMLVPPRSRAELCYNIVRWTDMPRGGHFAAMQEPALFVDDVRAWGRAAWS